MILVALRFDDPSATSQHELEMAIFERLRVHGLPATVATIPVRHYEDRYVSLNEDNAAHLINAQRNGVIEIAQHGYSHEECGKTADETPSEFAGLAKYEQARLIGAGRDLLTRLFGCRITGFVPPWNTCDGTTTSVVRELGFRYLSAGRKAPSEMKLNRLPRTCQMVDIVVAVEEARYYAWLHPIVIAVMHHYDFRESGTSHAPTDLNGFSERLAWLVSQPDVRVVTLDTLSREASRIIDPNFLETAKRILPWRLSRIFPERCLLALP
jgi:peptidoglycan/xylan/chitin deacetylase (PgdA/CDA1 family)